jgi:hypothetical protein
MQEQKVCFHSFFPGGIPVIIPGLVESVILNLLDKISDIVTENITSEFEKLTELLLPNPLE